MTRFKSIFRTLWRATAAPLAALALAAPASAQTAYTFTVSVDFTGPFADVMPSWHAGQRAMFAYWNDTKGKELGVKADYKVYDMRYDAALVASSWPGILANDKPIMHLGMGGPDMIALGKRLPRDGVPMVMPTAMIGLLWAPNSWYFSLRPTYSQEFAALLDELQKKLPQKRALRITTVSTQGKAPYEDQVNGVKQLAKTYPDRFAMASYVWIEDNPVSATDRIRTALQDNPDVIIVGATTAQAVSTLKALKELGRKIPVITSSQNGLPVLRTLLDPADIEGSYSVFSFAPSVEPTAAQEMYKKYHTGPGNWDLSASQAAAQTLLALRTLERAVKTVGKDKVTGTAMYDALLAGPFSTEEMLGLTPTLSFDKSRPFPVGEVRAKAIVMKDKQIAPVGSGWLTSPELAKW
jgi:branched-chain amino acid transport system substrate-binding protein